MLHKLNGETKVKNTFYIRNIYITMKKYLSLVIILPLLVVSQTDFCGERPIKPTQLDNQSKKEYKQSTVFLNYKKILKEWKECMSPLAVSKRDEERLEQERQAREMQIVEEQLVNQISWKKGLLNLLLLREEVPLINQLLYE